MGAHVEGILSVWVSIYIPILRTMADVHVKNVQSFDWLSRCGQPRTHDIKSDQRVPGTHITPGMPMSRVLSWKRKR